VRIRALLLDGQEFGMFIIFLHYTPKVAL